MAEETDTSVKEPAGAAGTEMLEQVEKEIQEKFTSIDNTEDMLDSSKDLAKIRVLDDKMYWFEEQLRQDQALLTKLQRGNALNLYNKGELMNLPLSIETTINKILEGMEFALGRDIDQIGEAFNPNLIMSELQKMVTDFSEKLMPLVQIPAMPEVPIIGDMNEIMDQMVAMSQLAAKLSPDELSANQKEKDHKWYEIPPEIKSQINDIKEDVQSVIQQLPMLLINFLISCVATLWKLVKKIMDVLGLSDAAFPLNLIDSAKELATSIWQLMKDFKVMIERIVRSLINKIIAIYEYAFGPSLDDKFVMDKLSAEIDQLKICLASETIIEPTPGCEEKDRIILKGYPSRIDYMREQYAKHIGSERENAQRESAEAMQTSWLGRNTVGAVRSLGGSIDSALEFPEGLPSIAEKIVKNETDSAISQALQLAAKQNGINLSNTAADAAKKAMNLGKEQGGNLTGDLASKAKSMTTALQNASKKLNSSLPS